jgi:hypothetical protein
VENALFESFCGDLSPESDTNRWNYKFTWAPRNVVLAGRQVQQFIQEGTYKYIPIVIYLEEQSFSKWKDMVALRLIQIGTLYRSVYGLDDVLTLYRGTIRG